MFGKLIVFIIIIVCIVVLWYNIHHILPYISQYLFGKSAVINLQKINTFEDYLNKNLNSKKRRALKKVIKNEYNNITIKNGTFSKKYIMYLNEFLKSKYKSNLTSTIYLILSTLLLITNKLNFFEYYKNNEFIGWSSYFIKNDIYYDFISSPNNLNITVIGIHSIKYCIENNIFVLDMGPTNIDLKKRKFNASF